MQVTSITNIKLAKLIFKLIINIKLAKLIFKLKYDGCYQRFEYTRIDKFKNNSFFLLLIR